jgi:hypothetical protein
VTYLDATREPERHEYLALATRQVVLVIELGEVEIVEELIGAEFTASTPPPGA